MKLKNILLLSVIAFITCCTMTSCEKDRRMSTITFVNTTSSYGLQLYVDGEACYSDSWRLWPGEKYQWTPIENLTVDYWCIDYPVDIKVEWYKMTGEHSFNKKVSHEFTMKDVTFKYDCKYKITIREKNFTVQLVN